MALTRSQSALWQRATRLIPGGVNSLVCAMRAVGLEEPLGQRGEGAWLEDAEGKRYVDWVMSWGPLLGHADASSRPSRRPLPARPPAPRPRRRSSWFAEIADAVPSVEMVRLGLGRGHGGGDDRCAACSAASPAATDRQVRRLLPRHADALLAAAGSGLATLGLPASPGVPASAAADTVVCPFNDVNAIQAVVERHRRAPRRDPRRAGRYNMGVVSCPSRASRGASAPRATRRRLARLRRGHRLSPPARTSSPSAGPARCWERSSAVAVAGCVRWESGT